MLFLAVDACFRLKRRLVSSERRDPGLGTGWAYFTESEPYRQYLLSVTDQKEVSSRRTRGYRGANINFTSRSVHVAAWPLWITPTPNFLAGIAVLEWGWESARAMNSCSPMASATFKKGKGTSFVVKLVVTFSDVKSDTPTWITYLPPSFDTSTTASEKLSHTISSASGGNP